jgi:hypothetical protein
MGLCVVAANHNVFGPCIPMKTTERLIAYAGRRCRSTMAESPSMIHWYCRLGDWALCHGRQRYLHLATYTSVCRGCTVQPKGMRLGSSRSRGSQRVRYCTSVCTHSVKSPQTGFVSSVETLPCSSFFNTLVLRGCDGSARCSSLPSFSTDGWPRRVVVHDGA